MKSTLFKLVGFSLLTKAIILITFTLIYFNFDSSNRIINIDLLHNSDKSTIIVEFASPASYAVRLDPEQNSIRVDFANTNISPSLIEKALSDKFVKLAYLYKHAGKKKIAGLRIFPDTAGLKKIATENSKIKLIFSDRIKTSDKNLSFSESLMNPGEQKFKPVKIDLTDTESLPVILELARLAEISIEFSNFIPETISLNSYANTPTNAIAQIAKSFGGKLIKKNKSWQLEGLKL